MVFRYRRSSGTSHNNCVAFQIVSDDNPSMEPFQMSDMPNQAWENLSMDFCGPLPTGQYLFVIIDEHSRYPVVEIVNSVSANTVIPVLDKVLSIFGIPKIVKTDNGSQFNSAQFASYAKFCGFIHRNITPH